MEWIFNEKVKEKLNQQDNLNNKVEIVQKLDGELEGKEVKICICYRVYQLTKRKSKNQKNTLNMKKNKNLCKRSWKANKLRVLWKEIKKFKRRNIRKIKSFRAFALRLPQNFKWTTIKLLL